HQHRGPPGRHTRRDNVAHRARRRVLRLVLLDPARDARRRRRTCLGRHLPALAPPVRIPVRPPRPLRTRIRAARCTRDNSEQGQSPPRRAAHQLSRPARRSEGCGGHGGHGGCGCGCRGSSSSRCACARLPQALAAQLAPQGEHLDAEPQGPPALARRRDLVRRHPPSAPAFCAAARRAWGWWGRWRWKRECWWRECWWREWCWWRRRRWRRWRSSRSSRSRSRRQHRQWTHRQPAPESRSPRQHGRAHTSTAWPRRAARCHGARTVHEPRRRAFASERPARAAGRPEQRPRRSPPAAAAAEELGVGRPRAPESPCRLWQTRGGPARVAGAGGPLLPRPARPHRVARALAVHRRRSSRRAAPAQPVGRAPHGGGGVRGARRADAARQPDARADDLRARRISGVEDGSQHAHAHALADAVRHGAARDVPVPRVAVLLAAGHGLARDALAARALELGGAQHGVDGALGRGTAAAVV
ncbi:uncharacterized protein PHACADRAFT_214962, partial [Phanerochaete carnosa HHB-10118-sp]